MKRKIFVPDMHCEKCVERISRALNDAGIEFTVDLVQKTVTVDGCEHSFATAVSEIYDLGFSPEEA